MPKTVGELLSEVLDEAAPPVSFDAEHLDAQAEDLARRFRRVRDEIDGVTAPTGDEALKPEDLVGFVEGARLLTHDQQRLLFTSPALREQFRVLKEDRAVRLGTGEAASSTDVAIFEMPAQRAAATKVSREYRRALRGGELQLLPVGEGKQLYLVIALDNPQAIPQVLIVERARDDKAASVLLPPPDDGEILLVLDPEIEADAELIGLLQDPTTTGVFLR